MKFYRQTLEATLEATETSASGLTTEEATSRLLKNGKNALEQPPKQSFFSRFMGQIKDPMIIILIVAAAVSGVTAVYSGESLTDVFIILAVVIINALLGVYQESKAEKAIEALQQMAAAQSRVLRDGHISTIASEQLVVGDVVLLEAGDAVPADGRVIECASMQIEEAALTGESVPVTKALELVGLSTDKDVPLGDRKNMVYMGSTVVYGRGKAVITGTGMDTEMGKIADALAKAEEGKTPLQIKLHQLSGVLTKLVLGICAFIFVFSLIRAGDFSGALMIETFMIAVSLAVAAIPEGLAAVVTIVLSIGVTNMSKRNAIIRKLTAVETLGCAQIICSDKTGTLTQNKMTVTAHYASDERLLATAMTLCSDAEPSPTGEATGEPTECALVNYATGLGILKPELSQERPRIGEAPFDSGRKMMSTVHNSKTEGIVQYTKGAPDEVVLRCTHYWEDGKAHEMTEQKRADIFDQNKQMADRALRVLAAAMRLYDSAPTSFEHGELEHKLIFVGLCGMIDPVRPEVKDAIAECRKAGIRPIMITGDHRDTAIAIALELGIITERNQAISGVDLDELDDKQLSERIGEFSVYARVQPEHKVRIVNAWRERGHVTAMTGDGVNDAPSIKNADIGVGMGITGTDVTKNVADMVLVDDNFATIVGAVEEGRRIYDNIRKAIQFLLGSNMSEVLAIFVATIFGFIILEPVHLLWINLVTDTFPALALGMELAEPGIMTRKPRKTNEGIFSGGLGTDVIYQGIMVAVLTLIAYFIGHHAEVGTWGVGDSELGITMAFLTMSISEIFHSFNMRSQRGSIFKLPHRNKSLWLACIVSFVLTAGVIYIPPVANAFGLHAIPVEMYAISVGLAITTIPIVETVKAVQRKLAK